MNPISALSRLTSLFAQASRPKPPVDVKPQVGAPVGAARPRAAAAVEFSAGALRASEELGLRLREIGAALNAARDGRGGGAGLGPVQGEIDKLLEEIAGVEGAASRGLADRYKVGRVSPDVAEYRVHGVNLAPGGSVDVVVEVRASAQVGALYLSLGGTALELNTTSSFTIEIGGSVGARNLTFASGTSLESMAAAIDHFSDVTGVTASVVQSGASQGIKLHSLELGSEAFTSVRVIAEGGIASEGLGVYRMRADDAEAADAGTRTEFSAKAGRIGDFGQDIVALVNGVEARGRGAMLRVRTEAFRAAIRLGTGAAVDGVNAQTLGIFTAFSIVREGAGGEPFGSTL